MHLIFDIIFIIVSDLLPNLNEFRMNRTQLVWSQKKPSSLFNVSMKKINEAARIFPPGVRFIPIHHPVMPICTNII